MYCGFTCLSDLAVSDAACELELSSLQRWLPIWCIVFVSRAYTASTDPLSELGLYD